MKNPISATPVDGWVEMANREGKKIYAHPQATNADLLKAGVHDIGIVEPSTPMGPHEYRNTR
jgi:hypothetical protein